MHLLIYKCTESEHRLSVNLHLTSRPHLVKQLVGLSIPVKKTEVVTFGCEFANPDLIKAINNRDYSFL